MTDGWLPRVWPLLRLVSFFSGVSFVLVSRFLKLSTIALYAFGLVVNSWAF